jgi:hypothetical protein
MVYSFADSLTGDVTLIKPLDYETLRSYRLVIRAQDGGSPSKSNTTQLLVKVLDANGENFVIFFKLCNINLQFPSIQTMRQDSTLPNSKKQC